MLEAKVLVYIGGSSQQNDVTVWESALRSTSEGCPIDRLSSRAISPSRDLTTLNHKLWDMMKMRIMVSWEGVLTSGITRWNIVFL